MINKHTSFIVTGAILVIAVATMTIYNVNSVNGQLAHVPSMSTKTITSGLGNLSKNMSRTMNTTIIPQAK